MANSFSAPGLGTVFTPGSYIQTKLAPTVPGLSIANSIGIIGESSLGNATSAPGESLANNAYQPNQIAQVVQKFGSGPIVDAFRFLAAPANDPNITGAPSVIYIYKTNTSTSASLPIVSAQGSYGTLLAAQPGNPGNLLQNQISAYQAPAQPTSGTFTYIPWGGSSSAVVRFNGGSAFNYQIGSNTQPSALVTTLNSNTNLLVFGGVNRNFASGNAGVTMTLSVVSGNTVTFGMAASNTFTVSPQVGDTVLIPVVNSYGCTAASVFNAANSASVGAYVVTYVFNTTTTCSVGAVKLSNFQVTNTVAAPANISTTFSAQPNNDLQCYSPLDFIYKAGTNRNSFTSAASTNVSVTVTSGVARVNFLGASFAFTNSSGVGNTPQVGDDVYIPTGSAIAGAGSANVGWYTITQVYNQTGASYILMTALGVQVPVNVGSTSLSASPNTTDIVCNRPWVSGVASGYSLSDGGASVNVNQALYQLGTTSASTFISTAATPVFNTGTEYKAESTTIRNSDSTNEVIGNIGGNAYVKIGYFGTTATVNISSTAFTFAVSGGPGANFSVSVSQFNTLGDFVTYVNNQAGFSATASAAYQALPISYAVSLTQNECILDSGTFGICSSVASAEYPGQIKADLYSWVNALATSAVVAYAFPNPWTAATGLPDPDSPAFLTGGGTGATSGAAVTSGIDAFQNVNINMLVPLFSQDASVDATQGNTAIGSTYTIAAINAYVKTHVLAMSTPAAKKNRLGVVSQRTPFSNAMASAQSLASSRMAFCFQDVKNPSSSGALLEYQPWMLACLTAGAQLSGVFEPITNKQPNLSSVVDFYGSSDFNPQNQGQVSQALQAGMIVVAPQPNGTLVWVEDQTTFSANNNIIPNSLSAMLTSDLIVLDMNSSLGQFAVGRPSAIITPAKVLAFMQTKFAQYLQNNLLTPSQGAPLGYQNLTLTLANGAYQWSANIFLDTEILYIFGTLNLSSPTFTST